MSADDHPPIVHRTVATRALVLLAILGLLAGAALGGFAGWMVATGAWPIAGLGQIAASGPAPAAVAAGGIGAALGGFLGGAIGLLTIPRPRLAHSHDPERT